MQDGLVHREGEGFAVQGQGLDDLLAVLVWGVVLHLVTDGAVGELGGDIGHVGKHASGLEGIPIEMKEDLVQVVGAVVGVGQAEVSSELVLFVVQIHLDVVVDGLLPVLGEAGKADQGQKGNEEVFHAGVSRLRGGCGPSGGLFR